MHPKHENVTQYIFIYFKQEKQSNLFSKSIIFIYSNKVQQTKQINNLFIILYIMY